MRCALLVSILMCLPSVALAQDEPPAEYERVIDDAVAEFGGGRWAEARALFERAHGIFPNARTLRGVGMAAFELGDYVAAAQALEASLLDMRRALTDAQRVQVEDLLLRCRAFLARFVVPACPPGAMLRVDDRSVPAPTGWPEASASIVLPLGEHDVEVRMPDGRSARSRVRVVGSQDGAIELDVAALSPPPAPVETLPDPVDEEPHEARVPRVDPRPAPSVVVPWVVSGIGGGVAIFGGALLGAGFYDIGTVQSAPRGTEWSVLEGANDRAPILTGVGLTALILGGLTSVIGIIAGVVEESSRSMPSPISASPSGLEVVF